MTQKSTSYSSQLITELYLYNSLSRKKEKFIPLNSNKVGMYVCGPTVNDRPHLGNVRSAVVYDILYRLLQRIYEEVIYVRNITDIDDKIIDASKRFNESIDSLTTRMTSYYHEDLKAVGCLLPNIEPKATNHLEEMFSMIQQLLEKGHAYIANNHVLFSVESYSEYCSLSRRSLDELIAGSRVEVASYKKHPADFVLWKPYEEKESLIIKDKNDEICKELLGKEFFASPWGYGRPGWHIECSAMSTKYLGYDFDIHGGGVDLIFPHHENEVAQSKCSVSNSTYARYWIHNGFLTIHGEKMSKSLGNFYTAKELLNSGISGSVLRYFYMTSHYHKPLDYNDKAIKDSFKALQKFAKVCNIYNKVDHNRCNTNIKQIVLPEKAIQALCDDLNTPALLAYMHELAIMNDAENLSACCDFLGFNLFDFSEYNFHDEQDSQDIPNELLDLANKRKKARNEKNWLESDQLKQEIFIQGYDIRDIKDNEYILIKRNKL